MQGSGKEGSTPSSEDQGKIIFPQFGRFCFTVQTYGYFLCIAENDNLFFQDETIKHFNKEIQRNKKFKTNILYSTASFFVLILLIFGNGNSGYHLYSTIAQDFLSNLFEILVLQGYCKTRNDGKYNHPSMCQKFVQCEKKKTSVHACPVGLLFDAAQMKCDNKEKVTCLKLVGKTTYGAKGEKKNPYRIVVSYSLSSL